MLERVRCVVPHLPPPPPASLLFLCRVTVLATNLPVANEKGEWIWSSSWFVTSLEVAPNNRIVLRFLPSFGDIFYVGFQSGWLWDRTRWTKWHCTSSFKEEVFVWWQHCWQGRSRYFWWSEYEYNSFKNYKGIVINLIIPLLCSFRLLSLKVDQKGETCGFLLW